MISLLLAEQANQRTAKLPPVIWDTMMLKWNQHNVVIKSPRYTGGDFMFLYRFVRRRRSRRRRPQTLVHAITF